MGWQERKFADEGGSSPPRLIFRMPSWLTYALILSCVIIFFLIAFSGGYSSAILRYGELTFASGDAYKQPWRWITYQYIHVNGGHIFFNILSMFFLVPALERIVGWKRALLIYTGGGIFGGLTYGALLLVFPNMSSLVGASGAVLAVLGAMAALDPDGQVLAMMIVPVTWRILAILYAIFFVFLVVGNRSESDAAHLGGLAFGWIGCLLVSRIGGDLQASFRQKQKQRLLVAESREQAEIDRILQKVGDLGMNSLNRGEKKTLKQATDRQRKRDFRFG